MANIIAVIWDCDKTLINGYMQDPIFKEYNVDSHEFWKKVNAIPKKLESEKDIRVNSDTYYLNYFIKCAHDGTFPGLNNAKLTEYLPFLKRRSKCLKMTQVILNLVFKLNII